MEFKKKTIIWESNSIPPKNYIWVKSDNKAYEYNYLNESWEESSTVKMIESEEISYSKSEASSEATAAIKAYEDKQNASGKPINPTSTITTTFEEVPETITLPETTHPMTLKGDFSQNSVTTIESNGEVEKVTINNTGDAANIIIDLPSTSATLSGAYDTVTVKAVSDNTLKINANTKVNHLILLKGTVEVNNACVDDNIKNLTIVEGSVKANEIEVGAGVSSSKFVSNPAKVTVVEDITIGGLAFGIFASGHYIWKNNASVITTSKSSSILVRSALNLDFEGNGSWTCPANPLVWSSHKDARIRIYDGKFFSGNSAECIYSENGVIEIYGGEFHNVPAEGEKNFLLNCKDANYKAGTANIIVKGGKFYGFDPANNESEGAGTNFVAEGYQSVDNGEYFEVLPIEGVR